MKKRGRFADLRKFPGLGLLGRFWQVTFLKCEALRHVVGIAFFLQTLFYAPAVGCTYYHVPVPESAEEDMRFSIS